MVLNVPPFAAMMRAIPVGGRRCETSFDITSAFDSKEWLDAHVVPSGAAGRFRNDAAGIAELAAFCRADGVDLVSAQYAAQTADSR